MIFTGSRMSFLIIKLHYFLTENNQRHLRLTIAFIQLMKKMIIMQLKKLFLTQLDEIYWIMHFKDTTHACLHMGKQVMTLLPSVDFISFKFFYLKTVRN